MFETLNSYFYYTVVADYLAYLEARKSKPFGSSYDLRAALVAATSLYHFREHLPTSHKLSVSEASLRCPDYGIVQDVSNVAKHRELNKGAPRVRRVEDIVELMVSVAYEDDAGTYFDVDKIVVIRLEDGSELDVPEALTNVINFWGGFLVDIGARSTYKPFPRIERPGAIHVPRDKARTVDMEMVKGLQFRAAIRPMRFNPALGRAEPIDLSQFSKARMNVRRRRLSTDVFLTDPVTAIEYKTTLELDENETERLEALQTKEEHEAFLRQLIDERKFELEMTLKPQLVLPPTK
ncbi:MAG: hypothetical protein V5B40_06935 [Candidatus Accumulibacter meliphilus]|jgi:hypothetical protein|uniref:hypothetical protein n=1 Tax=Candidatus Accumulibacter meliphilus TaxID=2211374 RepID=UPI002FC2E33A